MCRKIINRLLRNSCLNVLYFTIFKVNSKNRGVNMKLFQATVFLSLLIASTTGTFATCTTTIDEKSCTGTCCSTGCKAPTGDCCGTFCKAPAGACTGFACRSKLDCHGEGCISDTKDCHGHGCYAPQGKKDCAGECSDDTQDCCFDGADAQKRIACDEYRRCIEPCKKICTKTGKCAPDKCEKKCATQKNALDNTTLKGPCPSETT